MRIEQLQAFLAVAETGNFGQAARRCNVTQSTVSRQIQALEAELGLPLFHRSTQAKPTVAGDRLLPRARKICQEWSTVAQELEDLRAGKQPELCVAAIHSVCSYFLPPVLQDFCQRYPQIQLRVTALGSDRALKVLRDGLVDVAIVMNNPLLTSNAEMAVESLFDEPIEVLMAADHPFAARTALTCMELDGFPQVLFKDGYGMQRLVRDWFSRQGAQLNPALELNTLDAFRGIVRQGKLVALLPRSALLEARQDPSLAVRPIAAIADNGNTLTRQVILATTRDRLQIPPVETFCQLVRQLGIRNFSPPVPSRTNLRVG
ncbi:MAG: LysR family transcriptional regulator [Cyanobacteria bacterium J06641_5]